ncbi:MAG: arginase family protein [Bacteroidota bacterium]
MDVEYLFFPQWQGSGEHPDLYDGAELLFDELKNDFDFSKIEVSREVRDEKPPIKYLKELENQLSYAANLIQKTNPETIFTLGGDCSIELAPISFLNKKYDGDLSILWLDAHADLNTPESSPSGDFHGMPLRTLLGDGHNDLVSKLFSEISPSQIYLTGIRSTDRSERDYISDQGIKKCFISNIIHSFREVTDHLSTIENEHIYIHFDLDFLDPSDVSSVPCPEAGGLSFDIALSLIEELKLRYKVVGGSICEFNGKNKDESRKVVGLARELFEF